MSTRQHKPASHGPRGGGRAALATPIRIRRGTAIIQAGQTGLPWRLLSGLARIDRVAASGTQCAGLALPGDLLGCEACVDGHYAFDVLALTPCTAAPCHEVEAATTPALLVADLVVKQTRAAALLAARTGAPLERVRRLIGLLAAGGGPTLAPAVLVLPRLADMGLLTNLAPETVCRALAELREQGVLPDKRPARQGAAPRQPHARDKHADRRLIA
ncbi:Crp/Fnr family transcriptional regulator [Niveibacterium sp.]|uniref:Crp/Fnr family transcriptional regulator n=1 Tax=Niveibacterium sp. TaxID=2017444 RepID=UPI0035B38CD8